MTIWTKTNRSDRLVPTANMTSLGQQPTAR